MDQNENMGRRIARMLDKRREQPTSRPTEIHERLRPEIEELTSRIGRSFAAGEHRPIDPTKLESVFGWDNGNHR